MELIDALREAAHKIKKDMTVMPLQRAFDHAHVVIAMAREYGITWQVIADTFKQEELLGHDDEPLSSAYIRVLFSKSASKVRQQNSNRHEPLTHIVRSPSVVPRSYQPPQGIGDEWIAPAFRRGGTDTSDIPTLNEKRESKIDQLCQPVEEKKR